ncbi:MAG: wax ester/triacylglycerol synthase family O-acyltransferase [Pseudomonadales bacterium]
MHQLAGLDATFLYNETARSPQHIASIQVIELPEGTSPTRFIADFKALLIKRAHLVPYFTNRLQWLPLGLDHPVWVRDDAFDIDRHVRHVEVASPGGRREFEQTIAELHARPLDLKRPLWEICVLTGLAGGRIAYYHRVHHACLDGAAGQLAIQAIMDDTPQTREVPPAPAGFWRRPSSYGPLSLLTRAVEHCVDYQIRQATRLLDHVDTGRRMFQRSIAPHEGLGAMAETAPPTRFNRLVDNARSYATAELPLADVKRLGKATGTSLNDVFMAVCGGALRRYLARHGELPADPLIAGCPVSLRRPGDTSTNNQVTMMLVSLASNEADPVKRLLEVAKSARQGKGCVADLAASYDSDVAMPGLPMLLQAGARLLEAGSGGDAVPTRLPCNVVISNVPGPRQQLYSLGARVLTHYPVSIAAHTQAVNITVQSYRDELFVGITACARALPDADLLRDDLLAAFLELKSSLLPASEAATARPAAPALPVVAEVEAPAARHSEAA